MPSLDRSAYSNQLSGVWRGNACTPDYGHIYANFQDERQYIVWNDSQHRPKPQGKFALISNQTALPQQRHDVFKDALVNFRQYSYDSECPVGSTPPTYARNYYWSRQSFNWNYWMLTWPSTAGDWALKMRLKIRDESVNLGQSLVEYRETAKMFRGFARAAHDGWKLMHGRLPKRQRPSVTPCTVGSAYLMNSYGIQPLASDLFDSYEALRNRLDLPIIKRFHARSQETVKGSGTYGAVEWDQQGTVSDDATAWVRFNPHASIFGIGNPAELAWEIIPFSFVVDWAIPIGSTLAALDALKGVTSVAGTVTRKYDWKCRYVGLYSDTEGETVRSYRPGMWNGKMHKRDLITTIPMPRVPTWKPSTSYKAVLNGLALLTVLNKRCR